jgi:hypothetical protein
MSTFNAILVVFTKKKSFTAHFQVLHLPAKKSSSMIFHLNQTGICSTGRGQKTLVLLPWSINKNYVTVWLKIWKSTGTMKVDVLG